MESMKNTNNPDSGKPQYMTPMVCAMCIVFVLALLLPYMVKRAVSKPEAQPEQPVVEQVAVEPVQTEPQVVVDTNNVDPTEVAEVKAVETNANAQKAEKIVFHMKPQLSSIGAVPVEQEQNKQQTK